MTADAKRRPHIIIAGSGLGGLALAQALRKQGVSFEIFEKSSETRSQGYAIGIHSIIQDLIDAFPDDMPPFEMVNHLLPLSLPAQMVFYDGQDIDSRTGVQADGPRDIVRANRARLREWMTTKLDIQYDKSVASVEEEDDSVTVHFADGTSATGDYLVGADGAFSKVRQSIMARRKMTDPLNPLPLALIVGNTTLDGADFERQLELGHSCYISGFLSRQEAKLFVGLESVAPDGCSARYYWMVAYYDDTARHRQHWTTTASKERLFETARDRISGMNPRFTEVVDKTGPAGMAQSLTMHDIEIESLPVSRVTLLGDAAHCMTSFRGEGGVHAMQDSLRLATTITKVVNEASGLDGWKRGVDVYQKEMLERGLKAVRLSRTGSAKSEDSGSTGPRYVWNHPATDLPPVSVSLANIPRVQVAQSLSEMGWGRGEEGGEEWFDNDGKIEQSCV